jgi:glycosyltransferase involved in cell wall biosynthesis
MHILHIMEASGGGTARYLRRVVPELVQRGARVDLILSPRRSDPGFDADIAAYRALGCDVQLIDMRRGPHPSDVPAYRAIRRRLDLRTPQIVHSHCAKAGLLGRRAAAAAKIPAVHTPHSFFFQGLSGAAAVTGRELERYLGRITAWLLCVSEAEAEVARQYNLINGERIAVAANGLSDNFAASLEPRAAARQYFSLGDDDIAIAFFARMVDKKGHVLALEAVAQLPDELRARLRLLLVGRGPLEAELKALAQRLQITDSVVFAGFVPDAWRYLTAADLAVLPSRYEGLAYQLLEALAAGVPLIASTSTGNQLPGSPIVGVPAGDTQLLAQAIESLAGDAAHCKELGEQGRAYMQTHCRLADQVDRIMQVYQQALGGG